jgi:quaternary ammonium compound-resistance protein SugE
MEWICLILAGALEVLWALGMKQTQGLTARPGLIALTLGGMLASFGLLSYAMRFLPAGTAYAVWTGIGAAGTAALGILWLGESRDPARLVCLGLIVAGTLGLKRFS